MRIAALVTDCAVSAAACAAALISFGLGTFWLVIRQRCRTPSDVSAFFRVFGHDRREILWPGGRDLHLDASGLRRLRGHVTDKYEGTRNGAAERADAGNEASPQTRSAPESCRCRHGAMNASWSGNRCVRCHLIWGNRPQLSILYVRRGKRSHVFFGCCVWRAS